MYWFLIWTTILLSLLLWRECQGRAGITNYAFILQASVNRPRICVSIIKQQQHRHLTMCVTCFPFLRESLLSGWTTTAPQHESLDETGRYLFPHHSDVMVNAMASQIPSLTIVYSTVNSGADQTKHQSSAPLVFVRGIQRWRWIPRTKGQ